MAVPPPFIQSIGRLLSLGAEDIRLAKRGGESAALGRVLDSCLYRLCAERCGDNTHTEESLVISEYLNEMGYPRPWSESVQERIYAISWITLMTFRWNREAMRIVYDSCQKCINISCLWSEQLFRLRVSRPHSVEPEQSNAQMLSGPPLYNMVTGAYGTITQKLNLLRNLEECKCRLLVKISKTLQRLQQSDKPIPNALMQHLLEVAPALDLESMLSVSPTAPGTKADVVRRQSNKGLQTEVEYIENMTKEVGTEGVHLEKFLTWIGRAVEPSDVLKMTNSRDDENISILESEISGCTDMVASLESAVGELLTTRQISAEDAVELCIDCEERLKETCGCVPTEEYEDCVDVDRLNSVGHEQQPTTYFHNPTDNVIGEEEYFDVMEAVLLGGTERSLQSAEAALHALRAQHADMIKRASNASEKYSPYEFKTKY